MIPPLIGRAIAWKQQKLNLNLKPTQTQAAQ
jgi:hypothetical protein